MTIRSYIHSSHKRAETTALLDLGATKNFMSLDYAKWLHLPIKSLKDPCPLFNVDGTTNKQGDIKFYTDLMMRSGTIQKNMCFFLSNLGTHQMILGYPWFAAIQPKIDWAKGWIDVSHLPVVLSASNAQKIKFTPRPSVIMKGRVPVEPTYMVYISFLPSCLNPMDQQNLEKIPLKYRKHAKVFLESAAQQFPESRIWDHTIELKPGAPSSLPGKIYSLTVAEQEELQKFVKEHTTKGYIRPSKSPYAAPFFFIKKKDSKLRPVQDYRRLNQWTIHNTYPLPLIPQLINKACNQALFTKFDIHWGYNNIQIKKGDEWKAAFITNKGLYKPTVMFFGLMNSPATFQMMMNALFEEELREGWLIIYMDDMLIATHNNPTFHEKCIHHILTKLLLNDLYLKPEKCIFEQQKIEFLGVILQNGTIHMDPEKMQGVADWPRPTNVTEVQSFLGFTGFYRYFIPNYSKITRPLLDLTKKTTTWHWDERQKQAFEHLKTLMCRQPVLTQPDYARDFVVHTDTSAYGMGAILLQEGEIPPNVKTTKPLLHPIAYYSALFIQAERNYDIYKRELLAVVKALKHWQHHLAGSKNPFTVVTDHANLAYWKESRDLNQRTARWHGFLQDYWFNIQVTPGKNHSAAGFLSRHPLADRGMNDKTKITIFAPERFVDSKYTIPDHIKGTAPTPPVMAIRLGDIDSWHNTIDQQVAWVQRQHMKTMKEWQHQYQLRSPTQDPHLRSWSKDRKLVVPPDLGLKRKLMHHVHNGYTAGHPGRDETL